MILLDEGIQILRVKNTLSSRADAGTGYRCVTVNLRLVDAQAQRLRYDLHIAEFQLGLIEFVLLQVDMS